MSVPTATETPDTTDRHGQCPYDQHDLQFTPVALPARDLNRRSPGQAPHTRPSLKRDRQRRRTLEDDSPQRSQPKGARSGHACQLPDLPKVVRPCQWSGCGGRIAGGISPPGFHRSVRNSLPLHGSCRPGHLAAGFTQAQCAKYRGLAAAASASFLMAFLQVLCFLYFFMIQRSGQVLMRRSTGYSADG
jgi:hypothetical protein